MSETNEDTAIRLSISSWWHVLALLAGAYFLVLSCYFSLKADTETAMKMGVANAAAQVETSKQVHSMEGNIQSVADDVKWFRKQYESDQQSAAIRQGRIR